MEVAIVFVRYDRGYKIPSGGRRNQRVGKAVRSVQFSGDRACFVRAGRPPDPESGEPGNYGNWLPFPRLARWRGCPAELGAVGQKAWLADTIWSLMRLLESTSERDLDNNGLTLPYGSANLCGPTSLPDRFIVCFATFLPGNELPVW